jgi:hypothetical protein
MKIQGRSFLTIAAISLSLLIVSAAKGAERETGVRWDILAFNAATNSVVAGGTAAATAADGSQITFTGTGTFQPGDPDDVTGGGTWRIQGGGSGAYRITRLVRFDRAPGTLVGAGVNDGIGNLNDTHAGLVFLAIRYSDGSHGVLVVSCALIGTPANILRESLHRRAPWTSSARCLLRLARSSTSAQRTSQGLWRGECLAHPQRKTRPILGRV